MKNDIESETFDLKNQYRQKRGEKYALGHKLRKTS